jgi:pimeloyl-ACP methyl ester carboxylesterase
VGSLRFVHGGWQGAWVWRDVERELTARGHDAASIDLPGRDGVALADVTTETWVAAVIEHIERGDAPLTLVANDSAGLTVALVADRRPDLVTGVVYVAAYVPSEGDTIMDLAGHDRESKVEGRTELDGHGGCTLVPGAAAELFLHDAPDAVVASLSPRFVTEAVEVCTTIAHFEGGLAGVPRAYIVCTDDRLVGPQLQRAIAAVNECDPIVEIATGHLPSVTAADELARILDEIVGSP